MVCLIFARGEDSGGLHAIPHAVLAQAIVKKVGKTEMGLGPLTAFG